MTRQEAAIQYLESNYLQFNRLRYDVVGGKLQIRDLNDQWREMTKQEINSVVCDCAQELQINVSVREIMTVLQSNLVPSVHPLREYLNGLRAYEPGHPDWIDWVASQVKVRPSGEEAKGDEAKGEELWRVCFKKWFVGMVAGWMYDDVVNHQVLVLIGKQGIFKTTWLERLIPPQLRAYCCKLANTTQINKDDRLRLAEFGLINMDELDSMSARELNTMKSIITASDVNERAAYGYTKERRIRLASFCASSNRREFLTDITGNRRWLPFEVESIQNPFHTQLPYENLYAQAVYLVEHGYNYWFDLEDIDQLEKHNETFRAQESEEQLLPILFDIPAEGLGEFMTTAQISERLVTYGNIKRPMPLNRLGMLLGQMGFSAVQPCTITFGVLSQKGTITFGLPSEFLRSSFGVLSHKGTISLRSSFGRDREKTVSTQVK